MMTISNANPIEFKKLQKQYLIVYLLVMGADWLQGPYLYKLYRSYGLDLSQIACLFLTGFFSGAIAGTAMGSAADTIGRRKMCLGFCTMSICGLFLRQIDSYSVLFLSHILSGLCTALLYSVFEAWYVSEHTSRGFPNEWRARTFATGTFLNGLVAILAGVSANGLVSWWGYGAPYYGAIVLLATAAVVIQSIWTENYGEGDGKTDTQLIHTLKEGCRTLWNDTNIIILGTAQTFFECSMYVFVLLYTPAVENAVGARELPLGMLFSTLMFAVMMGSLTFRVIERQVKIIAFLDYSHILALALGLASFSFGVMSYFEPTSIVLLVSSYHIFEFTTGLYYPAISSLKADVIPEETRAGVMTLLRIPMNLGVGFLMWHVEDLSTATMFAICGLMTLAGCVLVTLTYRSKITPVIPSP
ncbi:hypothetical protein J3Q64DRAFT_1698935 [Phycomyces blakesleeanus]|uniref:Molybdate-anion transporter n=2 Tax=Phycomyces blakesleeanus TaxID=4837 RepID=A0A162PIL0_PHYB8|nr:hypothetical protein PHYBLDRAFT_168548 [Phycomyces blakesleeanus NRRL 1555(-)]OAD73197.1 hypothetical protein PHYBLDRAFT_168548 [Phycomyces blakesleeanus NRRL 1555(-)]|eukprot:XP_018291237.1 hypothetical protein PHYBLDRAFT_168548 [Phycomyces blakesleeanus NRRL 1555(-)]